MLSTNTGLYDWNVVGLQFNDLHKFFEEQYTELNAIVDDMAERAHAMGGNAIGAVVAFPIPTSYATLRMFVASDPTICCG